MRDAIIINYINEGLNKNELCIYGTVSFRDKTLSKISSEIIEYEKNILKNNLIVIDMSPFYIGALINDLRLFKQMSKSINEKIKNTKKYVRFVSDCSDFLFQNRHFNQCVLLESWFHQKPFEGTYLCTYPKSLFEQYPYNLHKFHIEKNHDSIINDVEYLKKLTDNISKSENIEKRGIIS